MQEVQVQALQKTLKQSLLSYFNGNMDLVIDFAKEMKALGVNIKEEDTLIRIRDNPHVLATMLEYSNLGLLEQISSSVKRLNGTE